MAGTGKKPAVEYGVPSEQQRQDVLLTLELMVEDYGPEAVADLLKQAVNRHAGRVVKGEKVKRHEVAHAV